MASLEAYAHRARGVIGMVDLFVAPSRFLMDTMIGMGAVPRDRIRHLPYPVAPAEVAPIPANAHVLYAGRVNTIKGVAPLLEAAAQVPEVQLVLAGRLDEGFRDRFEAALPPNARYAGMNDAGQLAGLRNCAMAVA